MNRTIRSAALLVCALVAVTVSEAAHADTLRRDPGYGYIARINKGVFQIGLENVLVLMQRSDDTQSQLNVTYAGGPTASYFLIDNLSLSLNLSYNYRQAATTLETDAGDQEDKTWAHGVLGSLLVGYHVRLGGGMFFAPAIGGGGFWAKEQAPTSIPGVVVKNTMAGGLARIQLNLIFDTSTKFNLKAGLDFLPQFGSVKADTDNAESQSFFQLDGGFNIGFNYIL